MEALSQALMYDCTMWCSCFENYVNRPTTHHYFSFSGEVCCRTACGGTSCHKPVDDTGTLVVVLLITLFKHTWPNECLSLWFWSSCILVVEIVSELHQNGIISIAELHFKCRLFLKMVPFKMNKLDRCTGVHLAHHGQCRFPKESAYTNRGRKLRKYECIGCTYKKMNVWFVGFVWDWKIFIL